ncbi:MAG: alkaline phosphatase family protein, partial [Oscillospiraceae bacterium]|nr:alkaline phosphatase family protein [Oscillospiraceae bacterium]
GDINGDGCIDIKDVTLLTSENTYNLSYDLASTKSADVNGDGLFDIKDLMIITSDDNYNKAADTVEYVPAAEPFVYERVVLLGVDGCGAFFRNASTPNMDKIFADGAITYRMQAEKPSSSAPCWGAMLHGVTYAVHGVDNGIAASTEFPRDSHYPSVFRAIREAYPDATLASFCNWNPINYGLIENGLGVHKDSVGNDGSLTDKILAYLDENDPKFLFVQFDQCDAYGHSYGYGGEKHLNQLSITDGYIGKIYDKLVELGRIENTLFIVTSDHGGTPQGGHGGTTTAEMNNIFAVAGETVVKNGEPYCKSADGVWEDMQIRDTAAVVLYALGVEQPKYWTAVVPGDMFEDVPVTNRPVEPPIPYDYEYRTHENEPTPRVGSEEHLTDYFDKNQITAYLTFDGNTTDFKGNTTVSGGDYSFVEGFYGEAIQFDGGYVELPSVNPGKNSFSVSLWFKSDGVSSDPCLVSNKNWGNGSQIGFVLSLRQHDVKFNAGDGTNRMDKEYKLPKDYKGGWVNVVLVVDRDTDTVKLSYDFGPLVSTDIPGSLITDSFNGISGLVIGQDGTKKYDPLGAIIDEVIVFKGAIKQTDITELAKYYGVR